MMGWGMVPFLIGTVIMPRLATVAPLRMVRDFVGAADADADFALAVANDDDGGEGEAATALTTLATR